jgi:hypothetical protein
MSTNCLSHSMAISSISYRCTGKSNYKVCK